MTRLAAGPLMLAASPFARLLAGLFSIAALAGCVTPPPPAPVAPQQEEELPPPSSRSFLIRGQHFPIGKSASLKVCVSPDGAISSVEVTRSSGEPGFDDFAMIWARQADVSQWVRKNQQVESCGSVRVEIGHGAKPSLDRGVDNALG